MHIHILISAAILAALGMTAMAADDPFVGTWKQDVGKSQYTGVPVPKEVTLTVKNEGDKRVLRFKGENPDGSPIRLTVTEPLQGGDATIQVDPIMARNGGVDAYDKVTFHPIDARHCELTYMKGGREAGKRRVEVSEDGRTQRAWFTGTSPDGKRVVMNDVWEKE